MKKLITAMTIVLCLPTVALENNNDDILTIEGRFVYQKNVTYKAFKVNSDESITEIFSRKGVTSFTFDLEVGNRYVVYFTSQEGEVKKLYVYVAEAGMFQVLVDFKNNHSAVLSYNEKKSEYEVKSIPIKDGETLIHKFRS